jgi:hypothetical protein
MYVWGRLVVLSLGMGYDASYVCIVYTHVGVGRGHDWRASQSLSELRRELQFFQVGWSRNVVLRRIRLRVQMSLVVLPVDMFVSMVFRMVMMVVMVVSTVPSIAIERASVHSVSAGRRIAYVGVIRLAIAIRAHFWRRIHNVDMRFHDRENRSVALLIILFSQ